MPPIGRSAAERANDALKRLAERGGPESLPSVLTSYEVKPLMGRTWFHESLRRGELPGVQIVTCGVWRCCRDTFVEWLHEVSNATGTMAFTGGDGSAHGAARGVDAAARGGRSVPRDD